MEILKNHDVPFFFCAKSREGEERKPHSSIATFAKKLRNNTANGALAPAPGTINNKVLVPLLVNAGDAQNERKPVARGDRHGLRVIDGFDIPGGAHEASALADARPSIRESTLPPRNVHRFPAIR